MPKFVFAFFSCLEQLNQWPYLLLAWSGTTNNQSVQNTTEWPWRLVTFETCDQSDEGTWPDQQKDNDQYKYMDNDNDKDKYILRTPSESDPRDLWPLRHLIRVMRGHDLTNKKTMTNTKTKTMTMTKTNTFWDHLQRATLETCDLWDVWSKRWGDKTWPSKRQWQRQRQWQTQRQRKWQIHLENTFNERP